MKYFRRNHMRIVGLALMVLSAILLFVTLSQAQTERIAEAHGHGVPSADRCAPGQNYTDDDTGNHYTYKMGIGCILSGNTAAGTGDARGPASSTDNAVTRFDDTTGKLVQNSLVIIDDPGSVSIPTGQSYKINNVALAKGDVGLGNADNTSDANKPVSTAQAAADALNLKIASNLADLNNVSTARTNLGGTTAGIGFFTFTNPGAIRFPRVEADNSVTGRTAAQLLSDIGAQTSLGYTAENSANKDASGGYVGLTLFKFNFRNTANTFTSFLINANTASRNYTFQDRNGTIADDTDLGLKLNLSGGTLTGALLFTDNTVDIGANGATRPRTGYFGTSVIAPTGTFATGVTVAGAAVTNNIVQNSKSAAYTTVLGDAGKQIFHPASDANSRTFTIDSNANVAYPIGTCLTFINMSANVVTISITSDTLYLAGTGTTGNRSLAQYGVATAIKISATEWVINGSGLT